MPRPPAPPTRSYADRVVSERLLGASTPRPAPAPAPVASFALAASLSSDRQGPAADKKPKKDPLYEGPGGWPLSPAYDLNPVPTDIKPRILTTAINEDDNTASLALATEVAGYFELDADKAREIAAQVGNAVSKWRDEAARHGLTTPEIDRMASAFEHQDLEMARDSEPRRSASRTQSRR